MASSSQDRPLPCPICGEVCHCDDKAHPPAAPSPAKRRFVPDNDSTVGPAGNLIDPEAYDASEQMFAASLEHNVKTKPRFVVEESGRPTSAQSERPKTVAEEGSGQAAGDIGKSEMPTPAAAAQDEIKQPEAGVGNLHSSGDFDDQAEKTPLPEQTLLPGYPDLATWRQEVAARLDSYQARRGSQEPRYPSLRLRFEDEAEYSKDSTAPEASAKPAVAAEGATSAAAVKRALDPAATASGATADASTRVIHFPRSSAVGPPRPLDELAEPVLDRPRILEAPEIAPVPPALGGILIEEVEEPVHERRPGFEIPLTPASMKVRMFAASLDAVIVVFATVLFEYVFFQVTDATMSRLRAFVIGCAFGIVFWAGYQFLLLVYAGSTPGLHLAGLRLSRFDDTPASQRSRRWRAVASILSILSLGLGYAWCFLDEDQLCWHDRITGTYLSSQHPGQA